MLSVLGKPGDARHLRGEAEILVEIAFIDENTVDAHLLEADGVVLVLAVGAVLQLRGEALLGLFQFLDDAAVVAFLGPGLINRLFELLDLPADETLEGLIRNGELFERTVRHDHRVIIAGGDARHGLLPVARGKGLLAGDEDMRVRIERKKRRAPLLDEMIGHDDHGLCREARGASFPSRRRPSRPSFRRRRSAPAGCCRSEARAIPHLSGACRDRSAARRDRFIPGNVRCDPS